MNEAPRSQAACVLPLRLGEEVQPDGRGEGHGERRATILAAMTAAMILYCVASAGRFLDNPR